MRRSAGILAACERISSVRGALVGEKVQTRINASPHARGRQVASRDAWEPEADRRAKALLPSAFGNALGNSVAGAGSGGGGQSVAVLEDFYRDMEGSSDGTGEFLPVQFRGRQNATFTSEANAAFEQRIADMSDPNEIARAMLDRARDGGLIGNDAYDRIVNGEDQSAAAYGRAVWQSVIDNRERLIIANGDDLREMNRSITGQYWDGFRARPTMYWLGLATMASDQVLTGLEFTSGASGWLGERTGFVSSVDRIALNEGLAFGNRLIARDMLPMFDVYDKLGGYEALKAIAGFRVDSMGNFAPLSDAALDGFRLQSEGERYLKEGNGTLARERFDQSLRMLALHEQRNVVQTMYDRSFGGQVFRDALNRQSSMIELNVAGDRVYFNDAVSGIPPSQRDIGNIDQRMTFTNLAADRFVGRISRPGGEVDLHRYFGGTLPRRGITPQPFTTIYNNPPRQRI